MPFVNYSSRYHSVITYASIDELRPVLMSVKHYCYIEHNKDNNEPHKHLLLAYVHDKSANALLKELKGLSLQNSFVEPIKKGSAMLEYLTHTNQPNKYQYSETDIVYDSKEYWLDIFVDEHEKMLALAEEKKQQEEAKALSEREFIDDLIESRLSHKEMAYKYGRDYIRNCRSYLEFKRLVEAEEEEARNTALKQQIEEMEYELSTANTVYHMDMTSADEQFYIEKLYLKGIEKSMKINAKIIGKSVIGEHMLYQATTEAWPSTEGLSVLTFYGDKFAHFVGDDVCLIAFKNKKSGRWVYLDSPKKERGDKGAIE